MEMQFRSKRSSMSFTNKNSKVNVILSPHCDDAAFSLGASLLSGYLKDVKIITIFSLSNCTVNNKNKDIKYISSIRKNEDFIFSSYCPKNLAFTYCDLLDAPLRMNIGEEDVCNTSNDEEQFVTQTIINKIIIEKVSKEAFILAPLGLGNHIDHLILRNTAITFLQNGYKVAFYEDLPYIGSLTLREINKSLTIFCTANGVKLEPYIIKTKVTIEKKLAACANYVSQIEENTIKRIIYHHNHFDSQFVSERIWILQVD